MSKLLKSLENVRRGGQGLGFATRQTTTPAAMALVAAVEAADAGGVTAAIAGGADAVALVVSSSTMPPDATLAVLKAAAGETPLGLVLGKTLLEALPAADWWQSSGLDFVCFTGEQTAELLTLETAKLVQVSPDLEPVLLRAFEGLAIDGLVIAPREGGPSLSIADAARYRLLVGTTSKPVLAALAAAPANTELNALLQMGVDGLLLLPAALSQGASIEAVVRGLRDAVTALGPRRQPKGREGRGMAVLPRSGSVQAQEEEDDEE